MLGHTNTYAPPPPPPPPPPLHTQHRKLDRSASEPTSRYKTELCRPFEENGACKYGDKCQFAHGYNELRNLARHPKYKTELCRTYHSIGFCPYGPRCHFIHNIEEARAYNQRVTEELNLQQSTRNIIGIDPNFLAVAAAAGNNNNNNNNNNSNNTGHTRTSNSNNNNNAVVVGSAVVNSSNSNNNNNSNNINNNPVSSANMNVGLLKQIAVASSSKQAVAVAAVAAAAAAVANSSPNLIGTNSLSSAFGSPPTVFIPPFPRNLGTILQSRHQPQQRQQYQQQQQQQQQHHRQTSVNVAITKNSSSSIVGSTRPKPLNLSPTFSLSSTADSVSPPSSLSQSPTNSMAGFFGDDTTTQQGNLASTISNLSSATFSFAQNNFALIEPRQTPSPRTNVCSPFNSEDVASRRTPSPLSPNAESRLPVFNRISSTLNDFHNLKI
ncbi:hypothetical protein M0802_005534 [Mischocyttarus mexicanus]|nr:hypothetical protein M0802_005534 [Mischocyttarus mexicanus]